jgi:chemotaxis protein histidine kinase CheA
VEVSYKKGGQILHTINQNQLTLNELNEWCAQNGCEKFETKPSSRGTKSEVKENKAKVGDDAALQHEIFNAIKQLYPEADAKKIGEDNHLDIFISRIYPKRGAHLFFNTAKDDIKVGFYCRDEEFVLKVLSNSSNIESYANGIRILNNPEFSDAITAVAAANFFITDILSAINDTEQESKPVKEPLPPTLKPEPKAEQKITPNPAQKKQISENNNDENEEVDLLAGMNKANPKPSPSPKVSKATQVETEEEEIEEQIEENDDEEIEEASTANEKSELSSLLSKINKELEVEEDEIQEESKEEEVEEELEENEAEENEIEETPDAENKTDLSSLLSKLNIPTSNKSKDVELDQEEVEETPKEKPVAKPTPVVKKAILSNFDITDKPTINKLCERIKQEKILPHLPYINTALEKENYSVDNHVANFFLSKVYISDQNMEGFLYVNMDGFHSNCIDKGAMQPIFSWSGVKDIKYSEDGNNAKIDLVAEQGELTIRVEGSHALKILHHIYLYAWKEANDKFANESIIIWNVVEEMGIKLNSYPTQEAYIQ